MNSFFYIILSILLLNTLNRGTSHLHACYSNEKQINNEPNCKECHSDLIEQKNVHAVASDCETCHQSNGSDHSIISKAFNFTEKLPQLCYTCHDVIQAEIDKSKVIHGAIKENKSCVNCHSPHATAEAKLLKKESKELCLSCHNKIIANDERKIANIKQKVTSSKVIHAAVEDGCITCHKPHASDRKNLLADNFPSHEYTVVSKDSFALCFNCHDAALLEKETSDDATNFRNGNKNLHFLHINGIKGRSCTLCHDIHGSDNEHLIKSTVAFGKFEMKQYYNPTQTGGSCRNACHKENSYER